MKKQLSRIELSEMLVKLDESKQSNLKAIENIQESLRGHGGQYRDNRILFNNQIEQLNSIVKEHEDLYKSIVNQLYNIVNK